MTLTRMSSRTLKHALLCMLVLTILSIFASNSFAADERTNPIPPTTPTSSLFAAASCGYYPTADARTPDSYFTAAYNGLGFTTYGYDNEALMFYFAKKPASVVSYYNRPFNGNVGNLVNAQARSLITVSAYAMAYDINSLFITFDEPRVPGGKVYFKVTMELRTNEVIVEKTDVNKSRLANVSAQVWSGLKPSGAVTGTLRPVSDVNLKVFGSQGLYFPVNPLPIAHDLKHPNLKVGANFTQSGEYISGRNSGAKSTQKLVIVTPDKAGCEATSYIEIK